MAEPAALGFDDTVANRQVVEGVVVETFAAPELRAHSAPAWRRAASCRNLRLRRFREIGIDIGFVQPHLLQ